MVRVDSINVLNRAFRAKWYKDMRLLRPKKSNYPRGGYRQAFVAWQRSLNFGKKLQNKINDQNNKLVRASPRHVAHRRRRRT